MSAGHAERVLLADADYAEAKRYREVAKALVESRQRVADEYLAEKVEVPQEALERLSRAKREFKELNQICLRHAAKTLDAQLRATGRTSDTESAAIFYDIANPDLELTFAPCGDRPRGLECEKTHHGFELRLSGKSPRSSTH